MADNTKIEWSDATWNPITGCSVVSPGCTNCYAMRLAGTRLQHHPSRAGLTQHSKAGPVWTGKARFNEEWLDQPLRWLARRMIFVCAHGDLFHESVPDEWIDKVFAVMAAAHWHTFQVLTKRADRMARYMRQSGRPAAERWVAASWAMKDSVPALARVGWSWAGEDMPWPLPNIWLGVSAEDQPRADERIPYLLATPAAVHWISAEPLLGGVLFRDWWLTKPTDCEGCDGDGTGGRDRRHCPTGACPHDGDLPRLRWVVAGGESGPHARPSHPGWFRSLRDQCAAAGVPFLHKQNGEWVSGSEGAGPGEHYSFPDGATVRRVGKKHAGRLLDGIEHNGMPV